MVAVRASMGVERAMSWPAGIEAMETLPTRAALTVDLMPSRAKVALL
jgi:hypothetical protein